MWLSTNRRRQRPDATPRVALYVSLHLCWANAPRLRMIALVCDIPPFSTIEPCRVCRRHECLTYACGSACACGSAWQHIDMFQIREVASSRRLTVSGPTTPSGAPPRPSPASSRSSCMWVTDIGITDTSAGSPSICEPGASQRQVQAMLYARACQRATALAFSVPHTRNRGRPQLRAWTLTGSAVAVRCR